MMNTNVRLNNNEMLRNVAGGDYGDTRYEDKHNVQLYNVGDRVEVYDNDFHTTTERGTITEVNLEVCDDELDDNYGKLVYYYYVHFDKKGKEDLEVMADDIQTSSYK